MCVSPCLSVRLYLFLVVFPKAFLFFLMLRLFNSVCFKSNWISFNLWFDIGKITFVFAHVALTMKPPRAIDQAIRGATERAIKRGIERAIGQAIELSSYRCTIDRPMARANDLAPGRLDDRSICKILIRLLHGRCPDVHLTRRLLRWIRLSKNNNSSCYPRTWNSWIHKSIFVPHRVINKLAIHLKILPQFLKTSTRDCFFFKSRSRDPRRMTNCDFSKLDLPARSCKNGWLWFC